IYNGIDLNEFTFKPSGSGYAAWMGRLDVHKGPHLAIQTAKKLGIKLKLAGPRRLEIPSEKQFWTNEIEPHLGSQIEWVGDLGIEDKNNFLGGADVLINPYVYNEAFGLVTVESLACGTPAIVPTWGGGSEIIEHGRSGYSGSTIDEWVEGAKKALKLDRSNCRNRAEKFSVHRMVSGYEEVIRKLIQSKSISKVQPITSGHLNSIYARSSQQPPAFKPISRNNSPKRKPGGTS